MGRRTELLVGVAALISVAAIVSTRLVAAPILTWDVAWTAGAVSAAAATLLARGRATAAHRFRWTMWSAAALFWLFGQVAWDYYGARVPPSPNLGDAGWWGFAICAMIGVMRAPARSRSTRTVAMVETAPLIAAALAFTCALLWHDTVHSRLATPSVIAVLGYPVLYVSAAVVTLHAFLSGSLRSEGSTGARLVFVGITVQAVTFSFWSERLLDQTYVQGATWLDPTFVVGLLVMAAGGLWAARAPETAGSSEPLASRGGLLPGVVFVALCAALLKAELDRMPRASSVALGAGLLFCGCALMLRGSLLSRRLHALLDHERGTVADMAERESELARLNERLVEDSRHDALTGMRNRRALSHDLPRIEAQHRETGEWMAMAVCDVDQFKAYNDHLGHLAGDHALRAISRIIRHELREGDLGYRFGGEELLLVLPATRTSEAVSAVERVRAAVEAAALPHPAGSDGILTVSIGVAAGEADAAALLARADAALYEAKRAGRNRVVAASGQHNHAVVRERRSAGEESVPRQLRSMLAVSRAAAAGLGVGPVLRALAEMLRLELSFEVVVVNLRDFERDEVEAVVVLGDDEARNVLLGSVNPWSAFEPLTRREYNRCGAFWMPAGSASFDGLEVWDPEPVNGDPTDALAWQREDMLLLPVRSSAGEILAIVSVDRPVTGRRPDDEDISVLMAVADHAGLALERAQRDSQQEEALREQSAELRLAAVLLLAETLDLRDPGTGRHSRTVGSYARHIATALGLESERIERIYAAGVLHDLGKLGIADAILYKPGPLDEGEWREMKRHPEVGARILEHAGLLDLADWVRWHHERVDGLGYPDRLPDAEIPLEAKILAVADAYEAMIADRPYRAGMRTEQARAELVRCSGTQFDPDVVAAFLSSLADDPGVIDDELGTLTAAATALP